MKWRKVPLNSFCILSHFDINSTNILKDKGVNGKLSVNDVLTELSRVCIITIGARKVLLEITKKAREIEEVLGIKLFPKILRS